MFSIFFAYTDGDEDTLYLEDLAHEELAFGYVPIPFATLEAAQAYVEKDLSAPPNAWWDDSTLGVWRLKALVDGDEDEDFTLAHVAMIALCVS